MVSAPKPDFNSYVVTNELIDIHASDRWVALTWNDGFTARFHHVWLRDNCACEHCVYDVTREQTFELLSIPEDVRPISSSVEDGLLHMIWNGPDRHESCYDSGWLRHYAYSEFQPQSELPAMVLRDAGLTTPPNFFSGRNS